VLALVYVQAVPKGAVDVPSPLLALGIQGDLLNVLQVQDQLVRVPFPVEEPIAGTVGEVPQQETRAEGNDHQKSIGQAVQDVLPGIGV